MNNLTFFSTVVGLDRIRRTSWYMVRVCVCVCEKERERENWKWMYDLSNWSSYAIQKIQNRSICVRSVRFFCHRESGRSFF